jgi:glycosyltransferase involved in cell wall biosynthesis
MKGIEITGATKPLKYEDFDIYIFNRLIIPDFYQQFVEPGANMGKKFVWQCDDNLWRIPEWNPVSKIIKDEDLASTNFYINKSIRAWVSTDALGNFVGLPEKTRVLPNLIDVNKFDEEIDRTDDTLKIVWFGSGSHEEDFNDAIEPLVHVMEKYGEKISVVFWGYLPTPLANFKRHAGAPHANLVPKYKNLFFGEWFLLREYYHKLRQFRPDIAIMPLDDCEFNNSKSGIKYLEMSMAGAACVATDLPPYEALQHNETGLKYKPGDKQGWQDGLTELIENKAYRLKLNEAARQQIREDYSWQGSKRKLWMDAFLELGSGTQ